MFKNYFKIAIRSLLKQRVYSLINVAGLSVGLACCLLIMMHVIEEHSYDEYHESSDRIYRVALERIYPESSSFYAVIPTSYAAVLKNDYPEVEDATRIVAGNGSTIVTYEEDSFEETDFVFADDNLLDIFTIPLIYGDYESALGDQSSLILTESKAIKYFGSAENAVGKILETDLTEFKVTAIAEDFPHNTHFDMGFIASIQAIDTLPFMVDPNFISFTNMTYLKLKEGTEPDDFEPKIGEVVDNYAAAQIEDQLQISWEDYKKAGNGYRYYLQPLEDIHLHSNLEGEFKPNGNITYVNIFIAIAIFILIIACINFMNLATARSSERAREVGVRKVMGSLRGQLISQFLTESVLVSALSFLIAVLLISIILPYFNELLGKQLSMTIISQSFLLPLMIIFALLVGLLAGSYPALILSSFDPVTVMKGKLVSSTKGAWLRNGLVVFQFWISIVLVSGTIIIYQQMDFLQNKPLGFEKENVLIVQDVGNMAEQIETFRNEVLDIKGVKKVGAASTLPGSQSFYFGFQLQPEGTTDVLTGRGIVVDDGFIDLMGLELTDGRKFSEEFNDSLSIIMNETAVKEAGYIDPIGTRLNAPTNFANIGQPMTLVGVVKDFNFQSLHDRIRPLVMFHEDAFPPGGVNNLAIRFETSELREVVSKTETLWNELSPGRPYQYYFLNDDLNALYQNEQRSGQIFGVFAMLAILIACIGLFGLAAYITQQRTKEIGVRKVLGASVSSVVVLLSGKFSKLVLVAFVLAVPATWYGMSQWLEGFAYSIEIGILVFLVAGVLTFLVAVLTVSYQSIKAALVNPIKSLKYE